MHLELIRDTKRTDAVLGTLTVDSTVFQTLELPWVPIDGALCGKPCASCVPLGDYSLVLHDSVEHPKTFELVNPALGVYQSAVPDGCIGRCEVLLHNGNYPRNSLGCILLGGGRAFIAGGLSMVTSSDVALKTFQALVPWIDGHTLSIVDGTGP